MAKTRVDTSNIHDNMIQESFIDSTFRVKIKKLHPDAKLPTQKSGDVGWDLYALEDSCIYRGDVGKIRTGIAIADDLPQGRGQCFPKVEGRGGLASRGVWPVGGIVDPAYRGEIVVLLYNAFWHIKYELKKGDRIAQLVFYRADTVDTQFGLEEVSEVKQTVRGEGKFGSTGR